MKGEEFSRRLGRERTHHSIRNHPAFEETRRAEPLDAATPGDKSRGKTSRKKGEGATFAKDRLRKGGGGGYVGS